LNHNATIFKFTFFPHHHHYHHHRGPPVCGGSVIASMASKSAQKSLTSQFMSITGVNEKLAQRVRFLPGDWHLPSGKNDG
jgi:hypothetical protein